MAAGGMKILASPFVGEAQDGRGLGKRMPIYIDDVPMQQAAPGIGLLCKHGLLPLSRVSFEGECTGRRFYGCPFEEVDDYGYVYWIDPKWPPHLENALRELWAKFDAFPKLNLYDVQFMQQDLKEALTEKAKAIDDRMRLKLLIADLRCEMETDAKLKKRTFRARLQEYDSWFQIAVTVAVTLGSVLIVTLALK